MAEWKSVSFEDGVDTKIATHAGNASAHHAKYTDAEVDAIVDTHTAIGAAHHTKYTNAEAVSAVATADDYIKNDANDITTGGLEIQGNIYSDGRCIIINNKVAGQLFSGIEYRVQDVYIAWFGVYNGDNSLTYYIWNMAHTSINPVLGLTYNYVDVKGLAIKNPKNHAASALSGTKKLVEIDIGGTPYYFEVYPTKA